MSENWKSFHQLAKEDKEKSNPRSLKNKFCIAYSNPTTVIYCNTEEKRLKIFDELSKKRSDMKLFQT